MTIAVCVNCGAMKFGALVTCKQCGCHPLSSEERFIYSMVLSDHHFTPAVLSNISEDMRRGGQMPRLTAEQEGHVRQKFLPEFERMKTILGDPNAPRRPFPVKKRGMLSRIFGR